MKVLVTGAAGFIGSALSKRLLERGDEVLGVDNLNSYYDVTLKEARLAWLTPFEKFSFERCDISDKPALKTTFEKFRPQRVVNLAAQAGVRYSLTNPDAYIKANIVGFLNVLEGCRYGEVEHLVYASSSSVYGANKKLPFSVDDNVDNPVSLYAASKKSNELMAHSYSHLYQIPSTGLRFFTVYGPWGRPDMALFLFTKNILADKPIDVFNYGKHRRDFTYIDDIIEGVVRVLDKAPNQVPPHRLYNIGNNHPVWLDEFIAAIEEALGKKAIRNELPMQLGDVKETFADVTSLENDFGFKPNTTIAEGVQRFVKWYRDYYRC